MAASSVECTQRAREVQNLQIHPIYFLTPPPIPLLKYLLQVRWYWIDFGDCYIINKNKNYYTLIVLLYFLHDCICSEVR